MKARNATGNTKGWNYCIVVWMGLYTIHFRYRASGEVICRNQKLRWQRQMEKKVVTKHHHGSSYDIMRTEQQGFNKPTTSTKAARVMSVRRGEKDSQCHGSSWSENKYEWIKQRREIGRETWQQGARQRLRDWNEVERKVKRDGRGWRTSDPPYTLQMTSSENK